MFINFSLPYLWYDVTPMCTCTREYSLEFLTGKTNPAPQTYTPCWNRLNVNFPLVKFANARDVRNSRFFAIFWCDEIFRPILSMLRTHSSRKNMLERELFSSSFRQGIHVGGAGFISGVKNQGNILRYL